MKQDLFSLANYDFDIPEQLIAQQPLRPRDSSRLLIFNREKNSIQEKIFSDILDFFKAGDILVLNNTEVIKARLSARSNKGAPIEVLLLRQKDRDTWEVLVKPGKKARVGQELIFGSGKNKAEIVGETSQGGRILKFTDIDFKGFLKKFGKVPIPPYIKKEISSPDDYQTVYAKTPGAVAAPTAGLHFTKGLLKKLTQKGVEIAKITLHCGLATFRPVKTADIRDHKIDPEWVEISQETCEVINRAKRLGKKVFAVGTTVVRTLETAASQEDKPEVRSFSGETNLYLVPGCQFRIVDVLITNFHTPCSTNLILAASFCGLDLLKEGYSRAKRDGFRFFSFGDATLIF
ncbi:MAG: tRNA preQ1(34) S-adenosylmethionine ribosyltransferase-isomerase QueA [Candidatus Omnitrophota bacterium]